MVKYKAVRILGAASKRGWTIERIIPGEKPIPIIFYGSKPMVEAEMTRLHGLARSAPSLSGPTPGRAPSAQE